MRHCLGLAVPLLIGCLLCWSPAWGDVGQCEEVRPDQLPGDNTDYSDAPSPYPDASACCQYWESLGASWSHETSPREPNLDTFDDGVSWDPTKVVPGNTFDLTVIVTADHTLPCVGYWTEDVGVWVDWNQDGDFTDAGEQIVTYTGKAYEGQNTWVFPVTVPSDAELGTTWLRARNDWHWAWGTVGPDGCRLFGEVEDYPITVTPELSTGSLLLLGIAGLGLRRRRRTS